MLTEAYKAEYETTPITIEALIAKYDLSPEDIKGHETWISFLNPPKPAVATKPKPKTKKQAKVDAIIDSISEPAIVTPSTIVTTPLAKQELTNETVDFPVGKQLTEVQLGKIANFKELALDHCIRFMSQDAKFAEVKEFKDIVAIVDSLEKSYQKVDPDAGKPTINILINNLMERFKDDC
jgi:hypothetical protein